MVVQESRSPRERASIGRDGLSVWAFAFPASLKATGSGEAHHNYASIDIAQLLVSVVYVYIYLR